MDRVPNGTVARFSARGDDVVSPSGTHPARCDPTAPWASPVSGSPLLVVGSQLQTPSGDEIYGRVGGVWNLLRADRSEKVAAWARRYAAVRRAEGRRFSRIQYELLPAVARDHPMAELWDIRARSFEIVRRELDRPPLDVLDVGCGNGWASRRLALDGHRPVLVDINLDSEDGLGALRRHGVGLPAARAECEYLPIASGSMDVVLFNASLHYATDQRRAIDEAARVLKPGGRIVVADSPLHRHPRSGRRMVEEQYRSLVSLLAGCEPNLEPPHIDGPGFVDRRDVRSGWGRDDLVVEVRRPGYGWRWMLRRGVGAIRTRREPSQFRVVVARLDRQE